MSLFNLARMTVSSSGTGTVTLNAAVSGFLTFDLAGCSTAAAGQVVTYAISDTTQSEIASGTYFSSSITLTRGSSTSGLKSTNADSPINMSNAAQVLITPQAKGIIGRVVSQSFTANGTYTPTTGLIVAVVECLGGGGGGGGCDSFAGGILGAGGGGAGAYSRSHVLSSAIGTSQAVTVGAGGAGGVGTTGSSGGTTSFGSIVIAPGGSGGALGGNLVVPSGGAGGVVGTGNMMAIPGGAGGFGFYDLATTHVFAPTGSGGDSYYGGGAASATIGTDGVTPSSVNGNDATDGVGGGGSGAGTWNNEDITDGGDGGDGGVLVTEYCSL